MFEFLLPDLGEGIHEGEILRWHVTPGARVAADAPLVDVETDKAAVTIPSPHAGVLASVAGGAGTVVRTGEVLCVLDLGETARQQPVPRPQAPSPANAGHHDPGSPTPGLPVPATPATRRLARELGVDLRSVSPSGPAGRVLAEDVRAFSSQGGAHPPAAPAAPAAPAVVDELRPDAPATLAAIPFLDLDPLPDFSLGGPVEVVQLRSLRRKTARRMATSAILVPHVAHMDEADVTALEALRAGIGPRMEAENGVRLHLMAFVMRALARGLRESPVFNASLEPFREELILKRYFNLGFAAETERGLLVPVLRGADAMSILELARETARLASAARDGSIGAADLRGGTFTVTNIGPLGGTAMVPTINYPEVAILGMARVQEKPVVRDGQIVIRKILPMTLAFDHRVADGAQAARFMTALIRRLEDPARLLVEA